MTEDNLLTDAAREKNSRHFLTDIMSQTEMMDLQVEFLQKLSDDFAVTDGIVMRSMFLCLVGSVCNRFGTIIANKLFTNMLEDGITGFKIMEQEQKEGSK
jgi:hypothetical protein